jgi:selenocysteine lyase/cysteine desulfurase
MQPDDLPHKYESGNLNVPGIAGLGAAAQFLQAKSIRSAREHELALTKQLLDGLYALPAAMRVLGPSTAEARVGLVSVQLAGYDPQEVAALLDATHGIETRAGLHCAPRMHAALDTLATGGTLRISLGHFTTSEEVDALLVALTELTTDAT